MFTYHLQQIIMLVPSHLILSALHVFPFRSYNQHYNKGAVFPILQTRKLNPEVILWFVPGHKFRHGRI